ncbi:MAG: hypothetical protein KGQ59_03470 [Bdellovibrionales bacterium]|nr:hypothetical protein [Bdellovibrionales bacterium]
MKKLNLVPMIALLCTTWSHADIIETKYRVVSRFYDKSGGVQKHINTRAYIRYNDSVGLSSPSAKQDCLVTLGGKGFFRLAVDSGTRECVSNRNYIITAEQTILDMMDRALNKTPWVAFSASEPSELLHLSNATLKNESIKDLGAFASLRSALQNLFSQGDKTQMISLKDRTVFVLSAGERAKWTLELEPLESETLTH